jgi:hypothetical protein
MELMVIFAAVVGSCFLSLGIVRLTLEALFAGLPHAVPDDAVPPRLRMLCRRNPRASRVWRVLAGGKRAHR